MSEFEKDPWLELFETETTEDMKKEEERQTIITKIIWAINEVDIDFEVANKFPVKKYYMKYNEDYEPDPENCIIGTSKDIYAVIGDPVGYCCPFDAFLFVYDRDFGETEWWIKNRPLFIKKAKEAGWTE